ncbi:hypothetical protein QBC35DRAFT_136160 [Podospora australis]|uniref:Uncharacterized protein n=1 Tax=Podospora australis TaxID=1536484 RepID=A0AAN6WWG6_9PEZI|nr:hypothetical protein QBC35DRAFT_136160 [Podospora australis]
MLSGGDEREVGRELKPSKRSSPDPEPMCRRPGRARRSGQPGILGLFHQHEQSGSIRKPRTNKIFTRGLRAQLSCTINPAVDIRARSLTLTTTTTTTTTIIIMISDRTTGSIGLWWWAGQKGENSGSKLQGNGRPDRGWWFWPNWWGNGELTSPRSRPMSKIHLNVEPFLSGGFPSRDAFHLDVPISSHLHPTPVRPVCIGLESLLS